MGSIAVPAIAVFGQSEQVDISLRPSSHTLAGVIFGAVVNQIEDNRYAVYRLEVSILEEENWHLSDSM